MRGCCGSGVTVLRGLELVGLKHLDLTRVGGEASGKGAEGCRT